MPRGTASAKIQPSEGLGTGSKESGLTHASGASTSKYKPEFNSDPEIEEIPHSVSNEQFSLTKSSTPVQAVDFYQDQSIDLASVNESPTHSSYLRGRIRIEAKSVAHIPKSPKSTHHPQLLFFLKYHHETINHSHYCLFYDYHQLCTKSLLAIAEHYNPLRYAIVAFSALVYSVRTNVTREKAFYYYALVLQKMRLRLGTPPTDIDEYQGMVATILQLSTFDVFP